MAVFVAQFSTGTKIRFAPRSRVGSGTVFWACLRFGTVVWEAKIILREVMLGYARLPSTPKQKITLMSEAATFAHGTWCTPCAMRLRIWPAWRGGYTKAKQKKKKDTRIKVALPMSSGRVAFGQTATGSKAPIDGIHVLTLGIEPTTKLAELLPCRFLASTLEDAAKLCLLNSSRRKPDFLS